MIKNIQSDIISLGAYPNDIQHIQRIIDDKENTIHGLRKKLKILGTQHVQAPELTSL